MRLKPLLPLHTKRKTHSLPRKESNPTVHVHHPATPNRGINTTPLPPQNASSFILLDPKILLYDTPGQCTHSCPLPLRCGCVLSLLSLPTGITSFLGLGQPALYACAQKRKEAVSIVGHISPLVHLHVTYPPTHTHKSTHRSHLRPTSLSRRPPARQASSTHSYTTALGSTPACVVWLIGGKDG